MKLSIDSNYIIGIDEVGTGALAGPAFVCAIRAHVSWTLEGLADSKKLTAHKREKLASQLWEQYQNRIIDIQLGSVSSQEIDRLGLGVAHKELIIDTALQLLKRHSGFDTQILVDGNKPFVTERFPCPIISVIKADTFIPTVMAASIVAKVARDELMQQLSLKYPEYDFVHNVGYRSKKHYEGLEQVGPCILHRTSYKPIKRFLKENK